MEVERVAELRVLRIVIGIRDHLTRVARIFNRSGIIDTYRRHERRHTARRRNVDVVGRRNQRVVRTELIRINPGKGLILDPIVERDRKERRAVLLSEVRRSSIEFVGEVVHRDTDRTTRQGDVRSHEELNTCIETARLELDLLEIAERALLTGPR